jgi:hypothetical protein
MEYLRTHPGTLEAYVTGPQIARETFAHWGKLRAAAAASHQPTSMMSRQESRRSLLSGYMVGDYSPISQ